MHTGVVSALIGLAVVALYVYAHGVIACEDGLRYTSGVQQPTPFHRRFHAWPTKILTALTWLSIVALAAMLGTPARALMFLTLPGVWMVVIMPTTVDGPAMCLSFAGSMLWPSHPVLALACSLGSGAIHERGPVFCAIYSWSPWPLLGLLAVQWWAKKGAPNHASPDLSDRLVGHPSIVATALAHRPHVDLLGEGGLVWSLRGLVPLAAWQGPPVQAWAALGVAFASRLVGTDTGRCLMWAAPAFLLHMDPPWWAVALHVMSFRRELR